MILIGGSVKLQILIDVILAKTLIQEFNHVNSKYYLFDKKWNAKVPRMHGKRIVQVEE